jgi:hypothetical protein
VLEPVPSVCWRQRPFQHRAGGNEDRRHVHRGGGHHQAGAGLVAAAEQDDAVDRMGADRFLRLHRQQVAIEHAGRPQEALADALHRDDGGNPPACQMPRLISSMRCGKCAWQVWKSDQVERIAMTGLSLKSSSE